MFTLLDITQQILSSMDSDEVNSIDDTTESSQVALLVRGVYYDIITDLDLPEHHSVFELTASGDVTKPTLMTVPSTVRKIDWIKYNNQLSTETQPNYQEVEFVPFKEFVEFLNSMKSSADGYMSVTINSEIFEFPYINDRHPQYYTSPDDTTLIFDSYYSTDDSTLQKSKTMCSGMLYPTFSLIDTFVPDLNPQQFSLLINRAKERAFIELKQMENRDASREARRQKIVTQWNKNKVTKESAIYGAPRYGRN